MKIKFLIAGLFCWCNCLGQEFKPDTTINQINLEDSRSIIKKLKADTSVITEIVKESPWRLQLRNKFGNQLLTLFFHPGNSTWAFSEFKVQILSQEVNMEKMIKLNDNEFITEKGIKLGLSKSELIRKMGRPTNTKIENGFEIIEYRIIDPNSMMLKKYNQAEYFAIYKLKNDRIIEFHFGFVMP